MLPVTGVKTDDREHFIYPAQSSKVEPFLKVKVRAQNTRTQGTVLRVDIAVIICYFVMGDAYAKNCKAKK